MGSFHSCQWPPSGEQPIDALHYGRVLLKGTKILSPFSDSPETVLRAVKNCVPTAEELGRRMLTPHELRDCLHSES